MSTKRIGASIKNVICGRMQHHGPPYALFIVPICFAIGLGVFQACRKETPVTAQSSRIATVCVHAERYQGEGFHLLATRGDALGTFDITVTRVGGELTYCGAIPNRSYSQHLDVKVLGEDVKIDRFHVTYLMRDLIGPVRLQTVDIKNKEGLYSIDILRSSKDRTSIQADPPRPGDPPVLPPEAR